MVFIVAFEATKEIIWIRMFLMGLRVVPLATSSMILFYDNNRVMVKSKEPRSH